MRLLFVISDISVYGGTGRVTTEIAAALAEAGYGVSLLSLFGPAEPWFAVPNNVCVRAAGLEQASGSLRRAARISRYLKKESFNAEADVIILVDTMLFGFCMSWAWRSPAKVVCWEHFNLTVSHGARIRDLARLGASRLSHKVVVLTERDAEAWRKRYGMTYRVQAIWNPIPRFAGGSCLPQRRKTRPTIALAVGRMTKQKGFDLLLRAWAKLDSVRQNWVLRIVGSGEDEAALRALATELKIEDSVVFVGHVRDVSSEYCAASLYVMSSRWEGLPMTLLEAQHFGVPSVATDCPTGPREVLWSGSGRLVEPENPAELAHGLADLMSHPDKRAAMGDAAKKNASRYQAAGIRKEWELMLASL